MDLENYTRKQTMLDTLQTNLKELKEEQAVLTFKLYKVNKQIEKHENFLLELDTD